MHCNIYHSESYTEVNYSGKVYFITYASYDVTYN